MKPRSPFLWALLAGLAVITAALAPVLWQMLNPVPAAAPSAARASLPAPWQIDPDGQGGLRAFGLRLPGSTLADALAVWGDELQIAVIASRERPAALEAYTDRYSGGGVNGKLVLASDAQVAAVQRWQDRSPKRETIDAQAMRWPLHRDDRAEALRAGVAGLSFLPANRLDAATLQARFGTPAETLSGDGRAHHWLYPERGLAIAWDADSGRAVLQVVAPADFERRLRAPLVAALKSAASSPAAGPPR
jgi:hypothetical protein